MGVPFAFGVAALFVYIQLCLSYYSVSYRRRKRRLRKSLREIAVVYLDKSPRCVGALHTSGKMLVPASCVEEDGEHHVAFIDVDKRIPKMFPKADVYPVSNIIAYPGYTKTHNTGYNIAMLELKTKKLHRHIHRPVDLYSTNTNTVNVRMGWFQNSPEGAPQYCNETLYSNWFTKDTPKCAPLSSEFNVTYPLGYKEFTAHDGVLHIRSFNAPPAQLFNAPFSLHTFLARVPSLGRMNACRMTLDCKFAIQRHATG